MSTQIILDNTIHLQAEERIFLGEGLFETLRVNSGKVFHQELHWQRLKTSANFLQIPLDITLESWCDSLSKLLKNSQLKEGGIKALLLSGKAERGLTKNSVSSTLCLNPFHFKKINKTIRLIKAPWERDPKNPLYQVKSTSYLENILAMRYAKAQNADDVVFFNTKKHAQETTIANLFVLKNGKLCTPKLENGLLPGITRARILAFAENSGIPFAEENIDEESLLAADGMFLCNALQGGYSVEYYEEKQFSLVKEALFPFMHLWMD